MSVVHLARCEQYSECQHEFSFDPTCGMPTQYAPENWITLFEGDLQTNTGMHFCSRFCLMRWFAMRGELVPSVAPQIQAYKARRFWLVHPQKEVMEGVRWEDGSVSLPGKPIWESWDVFKRVHNTSAVQWIDFPVGGDE